MNQPPEYLIIKGYYAEQRAKRSNVLLMAHIEEGLAILDCLGSSSLAKKAFCLHPIVQNDIDIDLTWSEAYPLADDYRNAANHYLCRPETDWIKTVGDLHKHFEGFNFTRDLNDMLLADKIQNRKDFRMYHLGKHERSDELEAYFNLWIEWLYRLR